MNSGQFLQRSANPAGQAKGYRKNKKLSFVYLSRLIIFAVLLGEKRRIYMKKGIHPEYRDVIFWDTSSDTKFLSRSTSNTKETAKWEDGKEYPVIKVEVSSASHPFFTGKKMFVDTAGRVEKFKNKYQKKA
jgi:large subunit ribosomal protein L31